MPQWKPTPPSHHPSQQYVKPTVILFLSLLCTLPLQEDILELEQRYMPNQCPLGVFRCCHVYVDRYASIGDASTELLASELVMTAAEVCCSPLTRACLLLGHVIPWQIEFFGGTVASALDGSVTHVVVSSDDLTRLPELKRLCRKDPLARQVYLVTAAWVSDSVADKWRHEEAGYAV